jgi:hypothetical protein
MKELRDLKKGKQPELLDFALPEIEPGFKIEEWARLASWSEVSKADVAPVDLQLFSVLQVHLFAYQ